MIKGIRYSIDLERELHKALKQKALDNDITMRQYILKVLKESLKNVR